MIPNFDQLFDKGLISFDNEGKILISNKLDEKTINIFGLKKEIKIYGLNKKHLKYLDYHKNNIFQK